jgi:hypothetical protein
MKESMRAIMQGIEADSVKIIASNTVEYFKGSMRVIRYHHTDILTFSADSLRLDSGGWKTITTKDRINKFLPVGYSLVSDRGLWILTTLAGSYPFQDGMIIDLHTQAAIDSPPLDVIRKENNAWDKKVRKFVNDYAKKLYSGTMEIPDSGDCFYCILAAQNPSVKEFDHIRMHIEENYLVPSLIVAAANGVPCSPILKNDIRALLYKTGEKLFFSADKEIRSLLKRYIKSHNRKKICTLILTGL